MEAWIYNGYKMGLAGQCREDEEKNPLEEENHKQIKIEHGEYMLVMNKNCINQIYLLVG